MKTVHLTQATQQVEQQTATTPNIQSYWFTYDADNRVDISGGTLNGSGQIVVDNRAGSVEKQYDQAGNVVTELSYSGTATQTFSYDARGEMTGSLSPPLDASHGGVPEVRQYDADGRLIADVYVYASGSWVSAPTTDQPSGQLNISGWLSAATTYYYDADGKVLASFSYRRDASASGYWSNLNRQIENGTLNPATEKAVPTADEMPTLAEAHNGYAMLATQSCVSHTAAGSYDAEGNALGYSYVANGDTTTYTVDYLKQDGYLERSTRGVSSDTSVVATTDTSVYDAFGRRIDIVTHSANAAIDDKVRAFAYDAEGEILQRRDGTVGNNGAGTFTVTDNGGYSTEHYAYVQGQQIGSVNEHGDIDVLSGVTGFSNSEAGTSNYVAQDGDTMQSIAQQVYGDASLWYVVADANGFEGPTDAPAAGQSLKLPEVQTNSNTAETFKPYNPREISGSTTPSLPQAPMPPPSAQGCNAIAAIIVIAVAVVVSVVTYGALSGEMAGWAAGAIAGAAGSAASQLAGDALGTQHGFDWGQVLVGAVGGAIGGGVAAKLASEGSDFSIIADSSGNLEPLGNAIVGAASYVGNYEANKLVGEPAHFSWAGLVANAAGSAVAGKFGPTKEEQKLGLTSATLAEKIEANAVQDVVTRETSVALGDNHVQSWQQIAEDVFGNALGNAAIAGIERENQVAEQKQLQASIEKLQATQSAELGASTNAFEAQTGQMAMDAINTSAQATLDQDYASTEQALEDRLAAMPDPSLAASIAAVNADNQRIAALQASNNAYGADIQFISPGEQEEAFNLFPSATYAAPTANSGGAVNGVLQWLAEGRIYSDIPAFANGAYQGIQKVPGEMEAAVASVWGDIKSGWAHVSSLDAIGSDVLSLNNEISQLSEQLPQLPGKVQNWAMGFGNRMEQDGAQLLNYLRNTSDTQIAYDAGYGITSHAPMIALAIGTDGFGEVADGGELVDVAAGSVSSTSRTLIGKSGYASVQEFSDAAFLKYQGFVDNGYSLANDAWDNGLLTGSGNVSKNTVLGSYTDQFARDAMRQWLDSEGIAEGNGELIQINRYLYDPANTGSYRIPDVNIPGANQIYDATLANKTWATPQVRSFFNYSHGSNITIVRPTQLGGSYSVLPPW